MDISQQASQTSHKGSSFIVVIVTLAVVITGSILYWYMDQGGAPVADVPPVVSSSSVPSEPVSEQKVDGLGSEIFKKAVNQILDKLPGGDVAPTPDPLKGAYTNPFE